MNSNSKGHYQDEKDCSCKKQKDEGTKVLLKCKDSSLVTVTATSGTVVGTPGTAVLTPRLASISLDTGRFHDPCVKFDFSTNIVVAPGAGTSVAVTFQLNKLCKGETVATVIGNPWVYATAATATDIIAFTVCDCDCDNGCDCESDCCTYFISASTAATLTAGTVATTSTVTFNNPTLAALVVER
ncbi:DUF4489 domain-containing protein [Clostridium frigoris]|uniref:DUF4489 domain-containing protein n=1 Tax=Clostridium frigoris TaxID=205327 RepID=A0ABS6BW60_9CLOT|nr:DUF4489 domain-containing protein [Clostridium frigoris]MBU3160604.1 DUF4489 domain-containing protein [Clostridium frigoris]